MPDCVIGIDLGTTTIKAALFNMGGRMLAETQQEEELSTPKSGWVEHDPEAWYEYVCKLIRRLLLSAGEDIRVLGIGISSQGISFVPVDKNLRPLQNAISWLDSRARDEAENIAKQLGNEKIFRITGKQISECYMLPKLLWLKNNCPEIYNRTYKFLTPMEYAIARCTGNTVTEASMAAGSMMFDINSRTWSGEILEAYGILESQLPELNKPAGLLRKDAADSMGLLSGIPLYCAGQDQKTAAYGAGLALGKVTMSLGTAAAFEVYIGNNSNRENNGLPICPYLEKDTWVMEGCVGTGGAAIKWVNNTIVRADSYKEMDRLAGLSETGSRGVFFYPLLSQTGEQGNSGKYIGLSLGVELPDMVRAVYEGIVFEIRMLLEKAVQAGAVINQLNVFGGAAKGGILMDILTDVSGYPVSSFENNELALVGAAKIAAKAQGADLDLFTAAALGQTTIRNPDKEKMKIYDELYKQYLQGRE